jgi:hypothetical protein
MLMDEKIKQRFTELTELTSTIEKAYFHREDTYGGVFYFHVNSELFNEWATSVLGLLSTVFGEASPYYKNFSEARGRFDGYSTEFEVCRGVFKAAAVDYEKGFLCRLKSLFREKSSEILSP